eukprot:GSA120T00024293001.1
MMSNEQDSSLMNSTLSSQNSDNGGEEYDSQQSSLTCMLFNTSDYIMDSGSTLLPVQIKNRETTEEQLKVAKQSVIVQQVMAAACSSTQLMQQLVS